MRGPPEPRRAHVVYAHPEPQSFVSAMRGVVLSVLAQQGYEVTQSDLYAMRFNPVASAEDFRQRERPEYLVYPLEQRAAARNETLAPDIADEVRSVVDSDLLVLVFPVYWFSVPAILKGWIDRVFLSGTFYGGRRVYGRGGMAGRRALVVAALGGRKHMFGPGAIHGELSGMLRHLFQGTLAYVGYGVPTPFLAHHVPYLQASERAALLEELRSHLALLDSLPLLRMPSLDDYDETFAPRVHGDAGHR